MQTESIPQLTAGEYPGGTWYYEPNTYQPYRYVLGRVGAHPLVCIGINPSTAQPGALDPTLKSVERLAAANVDQKIMAVMFFDTPALSRSVVLAVLLGIRTA